MTNDQENELLGWKDFLSMNIHGKKTQEALSHYVECLFKNNAVVILDFNHLSELLGTNIETVSKIISNSNVFYYNFEIPKRCGGTRSISAPFPVLLNAQRWIYDNILIKQPLSSCAKGFVKNTSIIDNAREHLSSRFLLKMDLEDYFPSIRINRVMAVFLKLGYTKKISYYLSAICCLDRKLPQGAPTSPALSNIISKRLDKRLYGLAAKFNLVYTRYADDLTFSGNILPARIITYIEDIIVDEGFKVNRGKTKLLNEKKQRIITGVSISSGKMTIPKKSKREVRKNIHYVLNCGLFEHQKAINSNDPIYIERLLGFLFFWLSIEPENGYIIKSIDMLKNYSASFSEKFTLNNIT